MTEHLTDEQTAVRLEALRYERQGYVNRGLEDRVAQVDACIAELGGAGLPTHPTPAHQRRAARRPRSSPARETR